jgi:hypothetical protein
MKVIQRKMLDELIRLRRKYWKTGDVDVLPAGYEKAKEISNAVFGNIYRNTGFCGLVDAILSGNGLRPNASNKDIYTAFEAVGFTVSGDEQPAQDGD